MPLWLLPLLLLVAVVATMLSGIWLIVHLTALARALAGKADIVPARSFPRVRRRTVHVVLGVFAGGTLATLLTVVLAVSAQVH